MTTTTTQTKRIILLDTRLDEWVEAFLIDRKAMGLSSGTLKFYRLKLRQFHEYCDLQLVYHIDQLSPTIIREYLLYLENKGHNPGGRHACYRAVKAFLRWWEDEVELENWRNPIRKVKPPKQRLEPLKPVELSSVKSMIKICDQETVLGARDAAILLFLLDTGVRAAELCNMNFVDLNRTMNTGTIIAGKGGKTRNVFIGKRTRRFLRNYLRKRNDSCPALWINRVNARLRYEGLRDMLRRRAKKARVPISSAHGFRRAFALESLRNGIDVYSLQRLMGHADLQVLRRYLALTREDIHLAHQKSSPVDNW